ncbi:MAG: YdeI/OmpD-associated family protein [Candidatus Andersenbacteria bacterium]
MTNKILSPGVAHRVPTDLQRALTSASAARDAWEDITPLARNEWICWVESAKKPETRSRRIQRTRTELTEGKRRPCCWAGCMHR